MFKRKCSHCNKKVDRSFEYCPHCGKSFAKKEDYGLLGKNDNIEDEFDQMFNNSFTSKFGGSILDKMLASAMKMLEKEVKQLKNEEDKLEKLKSDPRIQSNFQLYINGKKIPIPENFSKEQMIEQASNNSTQEQNKKSQPRVSEETIKKSIKLPRKQTKTKLTRLKDKIIYELETPGLESLDKVLINRLENSIEIRIYTDKAVYYKNLPVKLPLVKYYTKEEKLFLEFKAQ